MTKIRTVAILRSQTPDRARRIALASWEAGIDLVEVSVQGEAGWAALGVVAECADGRPFGAGTVLTVQDAHRAVDVGAAVVISPGIDPMIVQAAREAGALPLPGVFSPSEVMVAHALGLTVCKFFPASVAGPGWLGSMRGPFPTMEFVAVGGIDLNNARAYLDAGAVGVGFGGSLEDALSIPGAPDRVRALHDLIGTDVPR